MSGLAGLLAGRIEPGVYAWRNAADVADLRAAAELAGWRLAHLDGWRHPTLDGAYDELAAQLDFPDYFGRNLDALLDCLRDLDTGTVVVWDGWSEMADDARDALVRVLTQRAGERPAFAALLRGPGDMRLPELS